MESLFVSIFVGVILISVLAIYIKFAIWEYKADREIEEMEKELELRKETEGLPKEEALEIAEKLNELTDEEMEEAIKSLTEEEALALRAILVAASNVLEDEVES